MSDTMTSGAYKRLIGLTDPDAQQEMSAAEYLERFGQTANALLRNLDSSAVDTETPAKTEFGEWLRAVSPHPVEAEYKFLADRRFRADWAVPELRLLFEYDGVMHHATKAGAWRDAEKANLAQLSGWMFIRVNSASLKDGSGYAIAGCAIDLRETQKS